MVKRKWLILAVGALSVLLCLCMFGVRLRIAPRLILSRALRTALTELDTRFENSPVKLLAPALDREGRQKADLQLETQLEHLGIVRYDMSLQTQLNPSRIRAAGTVVTGGKALDLTFFMDQDFAAVASGELLGGTYYGITYDSFSQDIRSRELLSALIGEKIIHQWEASVSDLQKSMSRNFSPPEFSAGDVPGVLYGLLALKPRVERAEAQNTYTVTFRATGQEIAAMAESYSEQLNPELRSMIQELKNDPDAAVSAVFRLQKEKLVRIEVGLELSGSTTEIQAELGQNPALDPLLLEVEDRKGADLIRMTLGVDTKSDDAQHIETIRFSHAKNGILKSGHLDYNWDYSTGEMTLSVLLNDRKADVRLNLQGEGDSLIIRTQDAAPLLNLFLKNALHYPAICTLNLSPGSYVATPEYQNLDQWSMEDLMTLLAGLGGLLGLPMP